MLKMEITLDHHGPRLIPNGCHLPDPSHFLLLSTFKCPDKNCSPVYSPERYSHAHSTRIRACHISYLSKKQVEYIYTA
jgi:hypothetical protein